MSRKKIILTLVITIIVSGIPYLGHFLGMIYTFFHELGHALSTLLTGGKVNFISLNMDGSGLTESLTTGFIMFQITILLSGYLFVPFFIYGITCLWKKDKQKHILYLILITMIITTLLFVRNGYGFVWSSLIIFGLLVIIRSKKDKLFKILNLFIISLLTVESLIASLSIFILSIFSSNEAGDASILSNLTDFPAFFWGAIFFGVNIFLLAQVIIMLLTKDIKEKVNNEDVNHIKY